MPRREALMFRVGRGNAPPSFLVTDAEDVTRYEHEDPPWIIIGSPVEVLTREEQIDEVRQAEIQRWSWRHMKRRHRRRRRPPTGSTGE